MSQEGMKPGSKASVARSRAVAAVRLRDFVRDTTGGFALTAAVAFPALGMAAALLVDGTNWMTARSRLQAAADGAALALASASSVTTYSSSTMAANYVWNAAAASDRAKAYVEGNLPVSYVQPTVKTTVDSATGIFTVKVTVPVKTMLGTIAGPPYNLIEAAASARLIGSAKLCLVALKKSGANAIRVQDSPSSVTGNGCTFYINSDNQNAIQLQNGGTLTADKIVGVVASPSPRPQKYKQANAIPDPLGPPALPAKNCGAYSFSSSVFMADGSPVPAADNGVTTFMSLQGKTYYLTAGGCFPKGIQVAPGYQIRLNSGVFWIGGKGLQVDNNATSGNTNGGITTMSGATLIMEDAPISISGTAKVDINAMNSGPTAGILIWASGSSGKSTIDISSTKARNLTGVVYAPATTLSVSNAVTVADNSPWTAIVVQDMQVAAGASVVLNSNYSATNVPPPPLLQSNPALQSPVLTH